MTPYSTLSVVLSCAFLGSASSAADLPKLPIADPASVKINAESLAKIRGEVEKEIAANRLPGCVVLVARQGRIVFLEAFGNRQVEPEPIAMTVDTVFDLASLTKPIATATSIMLLIEQKKLALDDRVAKHIPDFAQSGKEGITIEHLLTHQSGLIADNELADYSNGRDEAWRKICTLPPKANPGERFIYSDVGFIVLGEIVRRIDESGLAGFSQQGIFRPLGMRDTTFLPGDDLRSRCAPTEQRESRWMQGEVHDPRSYRLGGVAGHAGLFSTAEDLAVYAQMLLGRGSYGGTRILEQETVEKMLTPVAVPGGFRAMGWDMRTGYSHIRGKGMSDRSFGHGGFTGTGIWIDPQRELFVIFLSNRVHPNGKGKVNPLIARICTLAAEAIAKPSVAPTAINHEWP